MWFWIVSSIAGSILGSATNSWFEKTALGRWFYKKVENIYNWAAKRYGFEVLKSEDKWRKKYPNIAKKIDDLEKQVKEMTKVTDKNRPIKSYYHIISYIIINESYA